MALSHASEQESRADLAADCARRIRRRWRAEVAAVGVTGALAHDDDRDGTDVELVVATYRPGTGPAPTRRRLDGHVVVLTVASQQDLLSRARALTPRWPLLADRHLHIHPLDDDSGWLATLRDTHLGRLAEASTREFGALAQEAWCEAWSLFDAAARSGQWHDDDGAILLLAQARLAAAVTDGLLTRTYFRGPADAARRTGTTGLDLVELRDRLGAQATELEKRGRPVDAELF
ncbi:nucleotidyltransferase domain-containing protein [Cryptosporangium sp. NPDC048952]|uniref:nucleotidyltransferase domain-containing protein n=1 Tax=Cryptosporangium sp. NPDC048952 TaxID=3363961 RepID=UPI0037162AD6